MKRSFQRPPDFMELRDVEVQGTIGSCRTIQMEKPVTGWMVLLTLVDWIFKVDGKMLGIISSSLV
jgi:hypothetical protein